ncbi:MAG: L-amino acid N-acyltransferase YncA [Limisphaerales bacterium]|jgi:L-amino acid N-acyltransferase YncA
MGEFPRTANLPDGGSVELRNMSAEDRDAVLKFAQSLPEEDLLFLRVDLTEPAVVDDWMGNLASGNSTSLAAYDDAGLVGYATVHRAAARWTKKVGEIRVNIAPSYRTKGLGRILINEIFDLARDLGLKKLMANMTTDQKGAQAAFGRLGFIAEALLADFVEDKLGNSRDLVIMSYSVDGHSDHVGDRVKI